MRTAFWELVAGLTGFLANASVIGGLLAWRDGGRSATIANLNQRIRAWWGMIAIMAIAIGLGPSATYIVFAFVSYMALREFITLTPTSPSDHTTLFICFFIAIPVQYLLLWVNWYGMFSIFVPVHLFITLSLVSALTQDTHDFLSRSAKIHWALMVCVYGLSHAPALLILDIPGYQGENALLLFFFLLVVQISDVFQYVVGKLFGTRYLGTLFGLTLLSHQVGGFFGAWLGGVTIANTGSYTWMWYADILLAFFAALVNLPIREAKVAPRPQAQPA